MNLGENLFVVLFNYLLCIKIFHFQCKKKSYHTTSDTYYTIMNETIDKLMEVYQGIHGKIVLTQEAKFSVQNIIEVKEMENVNKNIIDFLYKIKQKLSIHSDLNNILDDIIGHCHRFNYLLLFE